MELFVHPINLVSSTNKASFMDNRRGAEAVHDEA